MASRFVVGIDLGTTNSALAYVDTGAGKDREGHAVPHSAGGRARRGRGPPAACRRSCTCPAPGEQPAGALKLPWDAKRDYCVGEFARVFGSQVPTRLVASREVVAVPPRRRPHGRRSCRTARRTPAARSRRSTRRARYLKHLAEAWNHTIAKDVAEHRLEAQDIVLTVPASFDAAARELTVEAARAAGFENLTLLEEPQAAFYAWLDRSGEDWRKQVDVGDLVLVATSAAAPPTSR